MISIRLVALTITFIFSSSLALGQNHNAFEKIYVCPSDILSTCQGTFYVSPWGDYIPVRAVRRDCRGMYVLIITHQCPVCGREYQTKEPPEGYCCPLWEPPCPVGYWAAPSQCPEAAPKPLPDESIDCEGYYIPNGKLSTPPLQQFNQPPPTQAPHRLLRSWENMNQ